MVRSWMRLFLQGGNCNFAKTMHRVQVIAIIWRASREINGTSVGCEGRQIFPLRNNLASRSSNKFPAYHLVPTGTPYSTNSQARNCKWMMTRTWAQIPAALSNAMRTRCFHLASLVECVSAQLAGARKGTIPRQLFAFLSLSDDASRG